MTRIKTILLVFIVSNMVQLMASSPQKSVIDTEPVPKLVEVLKDNANEFSFLLESSQEITFIIKPEKFKIEKDGVYFIDNTSALPHMEVKAEKDGELKIILPKVERAGFAISRIDSGNLLFNGSFEQHEGWNLNSISDLNPVKTYGLSVSEALLPLPSLTPQLIDIFEYSDKYSRHGKYSLMLEKKSPDSNLTLNSKPIAIEKGKKYYLTAFYYPEKFDTETAFSINVRLKVDGRFVRTIKTGRYWVSFPPYYTAPGKWRYYFDTVEVPAEFTGKKFEAVISLEIDGRPACIYWDDIEFRLRPVMAEQPGMEYDLPALLTSSEVDKKIESMENSKAQVVRYNGSPYLDVNGEIIPGLMFCSANVGQGYKAVLTAKQQEIKIISVLANVNHWNSIEHSVWKGKDKYDFSIIANNIKQVLSCHPDAKIVLRLENTYRNFADDHPESSWITGNGNKNVITHGGASIKKVSHISDSVRQEVGKTYRLIGEYLKKDPVGKCVIGIHMGFGDDCQWYPDRPWSFKTFDYSEGSRKGVITELRKMYNNDINDLRHSWKDSSVEFDNIKMPSPKELSPEKYFLSPDNGHERRLIDCVIAYHRAVITTMDILAAEFKKGIEKPTVAITYFPVNSVLTHGDLLRSINIDGIVAVPGYMRNRGVGSHNDSWHALGSFRLHNKIYLDEIDFRSEYGTVQNREYRRYVGMGNGLEEHFNQMRRNFAFLFSQGEWGWFRTIGTKGHFNWHGMYAPILGEIQRAAEMAIKSPVANDWGQVTVFRDDLTQAYYSFFKRYDHFLNHSAISIRGLSHSGLSWNSYLLSDLEHPQRPNAQINLFSTATSLSPKQIQWIEKNLQKDNNVLIFVGDAGRVASGGFERNIERLTGIKVKAHPEIEVSYNLTRERFNDPLSTGLPGNSLWIRSMTGPLYLIDDPEARPLAVLSGTRFPGMAVKRHQNWTAIYLAGNSEHALTAEFFREVAKEANITPIGPMGDVTYAGNGFLAIHAVKPGTKTLHLKQTADLLNITTGKNVAENVSNYTCEMKAGETFWFRVKYK